MKYKTYEQLKKELGDKYDKFMYDINLNLIKKIDRAIEELDDPFEDEDGESSWYEIADTYKNQIQEAISILKGDKLC